MSPEAQRIAIAESVGYEPCPKPGCWEHWKRNGNEVACPDFLNDLNAMHEVEKVLTATQQDEYRDILKDVCFTQWHKAEKPRVHAVFATAAQRAEAILRTLDKWVESQPGKEKGE